VYSKGRALLQYMRTEDSDDDSDHDSDNYSDEDSDENFVEDSNNEEAKGVSDDQAKVAKTDDVANTANLTKAEDDSRENHGDTKNM